MNLPQDVIDALQGVLGDVEHGRQDFAPNAYVINADVIGFIRKTLINYRIEPYKKKEVYPSATSLGPCGTSRCPKCSNSFQNGIPYGSEHLRRCATCKTIFIPLPNEVQDEI